MTLARKGSRKIVVGETTYRWTIDANDAPGLGIVVEAAEDPAQKIVTWVDHGNIVTPAVVRHCILAALDEGWRPDQRGPQLSFRIAAGVSDRPVGC
jgi:hypothetical protein